MAYSVGEQKLRSFLGEIPVFACLDESDLNKLIQAGRSREVPKGSILFFQQDPADGLYILQSGTVAIYVSSNDGRELVLGEMRPGDYFGELALITGKPRSTNAITLVKSELFIVPGQTFMELLRRHSKMLLCLVEMTANRMYASTRRESALAFLDGPARLARILLQLAESSEAPGGYITISQIDLARRAGLTRQTVAKILGRWRRTGWLLTGRGRVVLLDIPALENVVNQASG